MMMIEQLESRGTPTIRSHVVWVVLVLASSVALACSSADTAEDGDSDGLPEATPTVIPSRAAPLPPAASSGSGAPAAAPGANTDGSAAPPSASDEAAPVDTAAPAPEATGDATLSFAEDVWPIFNANCGPCHESQRAGGHNVGSDDVDISFGAAVSRRDAILRDLRTGDMPLGCDGPPGSDGCITQAELDIIQEWFADGTPP